MAKAKTKTATGGTVKAAPQPKAPTVALSLPQIQHKKLSTEWLLQDQIALFRSFFTPAECKNLISSAESLLLDPSAPPKKGEATRTNERYSICSKQIADKLWTETGLKEAVGDWKAVDGRNRGKKAVGLNSNIRVYRYTASQYFGAHYDSHTIDEVTGLRSEWTLLVYLTGVEDGVQGGQTVFYRGHTTKTNGDEVVAPLERGMALLHRHGDSCMLHEARPPTAGVKWVLRSDLLFG